MASAACTRQATIGPRLHVAVMRLDGVDHSRAFLVFPGQLHTQLDVAAFHLVVDRFA